MNLRLGALPLFFVTCFAIGAAPVGICAWIMGIEPPGGELHLTAVIEAPVCALLGGCASLACGFVAYFCSRTEVGSTHIRLQFSMRWVALEVGAIAVCLGATNWHYAEQYRYAAVALELNSRGIYTQGWMVEASNTNATALSPSETNKFLEIALSCGGPQRLSLEGSSTSDGSCSLIGKMYRVVELFVDGESITDAGVTHLAKMPALKRVSIYRAAHISEAGLSALANNRTVEDIALIGASNISPEAVSRLESTYPKVKISVSP